MSGSCVTALIVAAGSGTRAGAGMPKQYVPVAGKALLRYSVSALLAHPRVRAVRVVIGEGQQEAYARAVAGLELPPPVTGGATRQQSVFNGLKVLAEQSDAPDVVLIHDAARPFLPAAVIDRLLAALKEHDGAIPGLDVVDTIKQVDDAGVIIATPPRHTLRAAQTPQAFRLTDILRAHEQAARAPEEFSDDAAVAERAGLRVAVVEGAAILRKVTHAQDFQWAEEVARTWRAGA